MSPRDWRDRVRDILDAMAEIRSFTDGMNQAAFIADMRTADDRRRHRSCGIADNIRSCLHGLREVEGFLFAFRSS